jgi:hypothetical protein
MVTGLLALPLLTIDPIEDKVTMRLQTVSNLQQDPSFTARRAFHSEVLSRTFNPIGQGLGSTGLATKLNTPGGRLGQFGDFDSGLLNIPFVLGWSGSLLYVGGLTWLMFHALRGPRLQSDPFVTTSRGIAASVLIQLVFVNTLIGVLGMVFFTFLGLALAANVYHREVTARLQIKNVPSSTNRLEGARRQ